jgi:hypothetical protein
MKQKLSSESPAVRYPAWQKKQAQLQEKAEALQSGLVGDHNRGIYEYGAKDRRVDHHSVRVTSVPVDPLQKLDHEDAEFEDIIAEADAEQGWDGKWQGEEGEWGEDGGEGEGEWDEDEEEGEGSEGGEWGDYADADAEAGGVNSNSGGKKANYGIGIVAAPDNHQTHRGSTGGRVMV